MNGDLPRHCPECGAGPNSDGSFTLYKGFPFESPCAECEKRSKQRMIAHGRSVAEEFERGVFEKWLAKSLGINPDRETPFNSPLYAETNSLSDVSP